MGIIEKIRDRTAVVGVVGLGYVGLPLALAFFEEGFEVIGFDIDEEKIRSLEQGISYIHHLGAGRVHALASSQRFHATADFARFREVDSIIMCVPTPLNMGREPDLSHVLNTTKTVVQYLQPGQLVVLESTTYPGTTDDEIRPILEASGAKAGVDFFLAFSPEREDPNNKEYTMRKIPKVVGGTTDNCLRVALALYETIVDQVVPVSSTRVAEASKLLENVYRFVNITLVNELKMLFDCMNLDIHEVIDAAKTKPFGFQAFYPGPGLGGHCIPVDPFYLTWKAREFSFRAKIVEAAGEVNLGMPAYIFGKTSAALSKRNKNIRGSKILVLGVAYKRDVDDTRESPSLVLIRLLSENGVLVEYNDPYVPHIRQSHSNSVNLVSVQLTGDQLRRYDCVIIATDHSCYDYEFIVRHSQLIVDTRNAIGSVRALENVVTA